MQYRGKTQDILWGKFGMPGNVAPADDAKRSILERCATRRACSRTPRVEFLLCMFSAYKAVSRYPAFFMCAGTSLMTVVAILLQLAAPIVLRGPSHASLVLAE